VEAGWLKVGDGSVKVVGGRPNVELGRLKVVPAGAFTAGGSEAGN